MIKIDILKTIKERRTIHTFKQQEVDQVLLKKIFTYGTYAPTHYMKEPWRVKIYQGEGKQYFVKAIIRSYQRLGMIKKDNDPKTAKLIASMSKFLLDIPHHALIYFETEDDPIRYEEEYAAVCAFIQNTQLAAWEFGVGMLWTITPYMHDKEFLKNLELDYKKTKIAAVMQIGYPKKIPHVKERTPIEEKLTFIEK